MNRVPSWIVCLARLFFQKREAQLALLTLISWFMENNIEPTQGHYFAFRMKPQKGWDGITHCEVTAVKLPKHILTFIATKPQVKRH